MLIIKPAIKNKPELQKAWAMLVNIPHNTLMPFIHTIEPKLRFKCIMLEKAIIFFVSKYRKLEQDASTIPIKDKEKIKLDKKRKDKKKEHKINLNIPNTPNFNNRPASNTEIAELASQWTSGSQ